MLVNHSKMKRKNRRILKAMLQKNADLHHAMLTYALYALLTFHRLGKTSVSVRQLWIRECFTIKTEQIFIFRSKPMHQVALASAIAIDGTGTNAIKISWHWLQVSGKKWLDRTKTHHFVFMLFLESNIKVCVFLAETALEQISVFLFMLHGYLVDCVKHLLHDLNCVIWAPTVLMPPISQWWTWLHFTGTL